MITVKCIPDKNCWGDRIPEKWEMAFEEYELGVDDFAMWLKNILLMAQYHPTSIAQVFHPDLVKEWGYECADPTVH
jgi:hypothetical protein